MNLGSRLATTFALVAVLVAATVGALSYHAATVRVAKEIDRSLEAAATALATDQEAVLAPSVVDLPAVRRDGRPVPPDEIQDLAAQRIGADGAVTRLGGRPEDLPVGDVERGLAREAARGAHAFTEVRLDDESYRILTVALGEGRGAVQVGLDIDGSRHVLGGLGNEVLAAAVVVSLVAGLVGWLLSRRITGGLVRLADAAERVAAGGPGDTGDAAPVSGRDEVARLSRSFSTMLSRITEARETQERLVQDAAHELRTPLTSLRTNARVLRRLDDLPPASRAELVADLEGETRELSELVDELVALALTRRAVEPEEDLELGAVASRVAERVARRSGRAVDVDADGTRVRGRRTALERAVGNLVENAVKFDATGTAPVEVAVRDGAVAVTDHGPGIPADVADRVFIFDRGVRLDSGKPGTGLGLAIVRDVAEIYDGTVTLEESDDLGGLLVRLRLPMAR